MYSLGGAQLQEVPEVRSVAAQEPIDDTPSRHVEDRHYGEDLRLPEEAADPANGELTASEGMLTIINK